VDVLDFPLDPPNGADASGGSDFGVFRSRYGKFHSGEDWWGVRGRQSFGEPVYAIGHGLVTYAEPEGWNRDKGVIIVRHIFDDGREVLSFYGHLDPPSVLL
jgi:murein DD-endopeptidase MepM/ murein hydrolase activator NlpD